MKISKVFTLSLLGLLMSASFLAAQTPTLNKETTKKILAAIDAGDLNAFALYVSPSVIEHMPPPPGVTASSPFEMVKMIIADWHKAFPDSKTTVINMVAEGNMVTVHSRYTGTNAGPFMGMPATNKKVDIEQVDIIRYDAAGKGVEHWAVIDQLTLLQQLGVIPMEGK
jgi:predicted ester cyclase